MQFEAQVVAAYGRHLIVRDAEGIRYEARPFGRKLGAVCGDRVRCERDEQHAEIHVTEVLPREHVLLRANLKGGAEAVVANLTQLVVLLAPEPKADPFIIDRYLCAASSAGLRAVVFLNKIDQLDDESRSITDDLLEVYSQAGYLTLRGSASHGEGIKELRALLNGHISVFVGQSGVGKSSLVACLTQDQDIAIGALDRDAEGRHTTTASQLYELAPSDAATMDPTDGGALMDSPGVRDFAPAIDALEPGSLGFPEVDQLAINCRFMDCQHLKEPGCAVRAAVETGQLDARRYESYRRLRRLHADLTAARGPTTARGSHSTRR
ncbi:MAG: ribosome small subunit-dependent GTPase A [Steroidobacteraceae bacterium]|nr:ribosome small subunit-dependent GTPase A [Gammaproteobacteria bacterium]